MRAVFHAASLLPLLWLVYLVATGQIGADPADRIVRYLGLTGACFLWACLTMTPLRLLSGRSVWISYRRGLGLWAFFYLSIHLLSFIVMWAGLDVQILLEEVTERPYVYLGLFGWLLMVPLAFTSTRSARRRLGKSWIKLHRLIYPVALLGLAHMLWIAKLDYLQVSIFGGLLFMLFFCRWFYRKN